MSTLLCFRVGAYHLESRRPCPSAAGLNRTARYDVYRSATSLGEYQSPNCVDPQRAALDTARDVRCGHCTIDGIGSTVGLRAVYLSSSAPPGLAAAPGSSARYCHLPARPCHPLDTLLRYWPGARKTGASAARLDIYRSARSVGNFFGLHPGPAGVARRDLA